MIFGLFPLMVASGVGANGNSSLGTGTVGGMVIGTLALLFIVPSFVYRIPIFTGKGTSYSVSAGGRLADSRGMCRSKRRKTTPH